LSIAWGNNLRNHDRAMYQIVHRLFIQILAKRKCEKKYDA